MLVVRSLAFNTLFYLLTALIAVVCLPALVSQKGALAVAQFWGRMSLRLLRLVGGTQVDFQGLENLPDGPLLIAPKHQSTLETIALTVPFANFAYVLKRELMWIPLFGWYLGRSGMVPIDRSKGARTMAVLNEAAAKAIGEGRRLIVFPEGTRRPVSAPPLYKQGLSHLYVALGVPCVPVALNTGLFWRRRGFLRMPGRAVIEVLAPIPPGLDRLDFLAQVQQRIETGSNALIATGRTDLAARGLAFTDVPEPADARERSDPVSSR